MVPAGQRNRQFQSTALGLTVAGDGVGVVTVVAGVVLVPDVSARATPAAPMAPIPIITATTRSARRRRLLRFISSSYREVMK